jgi:hypothetical protein
METAVNAIPQGCEMSERSTESEGTLDPTLVEPILSALEDSDPTLRTTALWALVALPLTATDFDALGDHARAALLDHAARTSGELRAWIEAVPWIPLASVRELVARFADGQFEVDPTVRWAAERTIGRISDAGIEEPTGSSIPPAGFSEYSAAEREHLSHELAQVTDDALWAELRNAQPGSEPAERRTAFIVTLLMTRAGRVCSPQAGYEVARWAQDRETTYRPDLEGLFDELLLLRPRLPGHELFIARQIAWLVSRGGLRELVAALQPQLKSNDREARLAALSLIQYSAAYMRQRTPPNYWTGDLGEREYQEPAIPVRRDVLGESSGADQTPRVDEDVQFTLYRPSRITPEIWHPVIAFAHRTEPIALEGGGIVDPIKEVHQRAERFLAGLASTYEDVRTDSRAGLPRGTDLLFEPWIEAGEFNPRVQTVAWEEAVHDVHFRLRVPQTADHSHLRGGMRVFVGAMLVGDLTFRIAVSSEQPEVAQPTERDTTRRYRQIFASYSHRDVAVVDAVERFVSVTGDRYLIDARTLRSGEEWNERLCQLIDEADIFQLFWSRNAMESQFVRQEWEYALQLGREGFVRPVYWEDPFAEDTDRDLPPERLRRLHFSRLAGDIGEMHPPETPARGPEAVPRADTAQTAPSGVICARCGFLNPTDEAFCGSCGSFLAWTGEEAGRTVTDGGTVLDEGRAGDPATAMSDRQPAAITPSAPTPHRRPTVEQPPSRDVLPGDLICVECGEANQPERRFCRRCGATLRQASAAPASPLQTPTWHRRVGLAAIVAIVVATIALVLALWV